MSTEAEKPTRTFLTKLYAKLKELAGDKVSKEDFDSAVSHARGHAGGMAKAEKAKMAKPDEDETIAASTELAHLCATDGSDKVRLFVENPQLARCYTEERS